MLDFYARSLAFASKFGTSLQQRENSEMGYWIFTATVKNVGKESELFNIELIFAPRPFHLQMKQKLRFSKR